MFSQSCDTDFNNDGRFDTADTVDRLNVLAGAECPSCDSLDFNGDGVFPDDKDNEDWERAVQTGVCPDGWTFIPAGLPVRYVGPTREYQTVRDALMSLPRVTVGGTTGTPGVVLVDPNCTSQELRGEYDSITVGGLPGQPLYIVGQLEGPRPVLTWGRIMGADHVRVIGLGFTKGFQVLGGSTDIRLEDLAIIGGARGLSIDGLTEGAGTVTMHRCIIQGQRSPRNHVSGVYVTNTDRFVATENTLYDTGNRDTFCQGYYLVYGDDERRTLYDNIIISPGFAGIQFRGGIGDLQWNVVALAGNGIGAGHPMAVPHGIKADGLIANNWIDQPAGVSWGIAPVYTDANLVFSSNIISGARVAIAGVTEQGLKDVPLTPYKWVNNQITTSSRLDWHQIARVLCARGRGVWSEEYAGRFYVPR